MNTLPGHLAISASAGTGKTFQLAHRFIRLLMLGEAPERIIALTFSRKAAREIFDRVIGYLAEASLSESHAEARNRRLGMTGLTRADYQVALRGLLEKLPRSRVGTIDSFIVGIVRAFPYELGLEPDFQVFDAKGLEAQWCRRDALRLVLQSAVTREEDRKHFFESFKLATYGHEEKRSGQVLNDLVENFQGLYRLQSDGRHWGLAVDPIRHSFPDIAAWHHGIEQFRAAVIAMPWTPTTVGYWTEFCTDLIDWRPELEFTTRMTYVFKAIAPILPDIGIKPVPLKFGREEFVVPVLLGKLLRPVLNFMGDEAIRLHSIRTLGMFRLIERCEAVYDDQIRRRGLLTFEDALYALRRQKLSVMSVGQAEPGRLSIDYRLDGKLDHWLLDEFQDTSTMQWQVLSNLIDEVMQDHEGRRTFFYVGDVKQAIYGWRGGNAALFNQILQHYNTSIPPAIEVQPLDKSYRSSRPIIDTVNRVFGNLPSRVDAEVQLRWKKFWHEHDCADEVVPEFGYTALIELAKPGREDELSEADQRFGAAAELLATIDPVARGLTAAILCRGNDAAARMAEVLREQQPDLPVVLEGQSFITDNPAVSLMLSLLQWAEHPGDRFAWCHLRMSPLAGFPLVAAEILRGVQEDGFRITLKTWVEKLESVQALSGFERMRIAQLLDHAALADQESSRQIDRFVETIRQVTVEEASSRHAVRIMTVHKSKGLDFDVVILPDLQGRGGNDTRPLISWSADRTEPEWILQYVKKNLLALDDRLVNCKRREELRDLLESLCVLYVAMTRAASAMYLITTVQPEDSVAQNHANLVTDALSIHGGGGGGLSGVSGRLVYATGDAEWYVHAPVKPPEVAEVVREEVGTIEMVLPGDDRSTPSRGAEFERDSGRVFEPVMRQRRAFGSAVHAVFEDIAWLDPANPPVWDDVDPAVKEHVTACLASLEVALLLQRPTIPHELWREQSFEMVLNGRWVSGVFDRVVVVRDEAGNPVSVDIIDFKTNHIDDPAGIMEHAEPYRSQLETYRSVIERIVGLSAEKIRMLLVFTGLGRVVEL